MIVLRVLHGIHKHFPVRASEWACAVMLLNFGAILSLPKVTVAGSSGISGLAALASEDVWAWSLMTVGGIRLLALIINGTFADTTYGQWSPHVRVALALVSCFFWLTIVIGLSLSPRLSTGMGIYPVLLALDMWNCARAAGDAALVDRARHADRDS